MSLVLSFTCKKKNEKQIKFDLHDLLEVALKILAANLIKLMFSILPKVRVNKPNGNDFEKAKRRR
jgi:hypothetical protein